ncbi:MAG: ATP-dependent Clp protease proteolytic subunit [Planctomycetota bacterium]
MMAWNMELTREVFTKRFVRGWLLASILLIALMPKPAWGQSDPEQPESTPKSIQTVAAARQADNLAIIDIKGPISGATSRSVTRRIARAEEAGANAIVLEIDTPGGEVGAMLEISQAIKKSPLRTTAWINDEAYSAGAVISLACDEIVVARNATMGDAAAIQIGVGGGGFGLQTLGETERAKLTAPVVADIVDSARRNEYDENLVLAFVLLGIETWMVEDTRNGDVYFVDEIEYRALYGTEPPRDRKPIAASGFGSQSSTSEQSTDQIDRPSPTELREDYSGASGIAEAESTASPYANQDINTKRPIFSSEDSANWKLTGYATDGKGLLTLKETELKSLGFVVPQTIDDEAGIAAFHGAKNVVRLRPSIGERYAAFMSSEIGWIIRGLLIVVFLLALFVEMVTPGTGLGGTVAAIAFVALISPALLVGAHAWIAIVLVLAGLILILLELFVLPGFGLPAAAGGLCLILGLIASFAGAGQLFPGAGNGGTGGLTTAIATVFVSMFASLVLIYFMSRYWEVTPIAKGLILSSPTGGPSDQQEEMLRVMDDVEADAPVTVGAIGIATGPLRPSGIAEFGGELIDVVSEDGFLEEGARVRVVNATKYRVAVVLDQDRGENV